MLFSSLDQGTWVSFWNGFWSGHLGLSGWQAANASCIKIRSPPVQDDDNDERFLASKTVFEDSAEPATGIYASLSGAATTTCSIAGGVWKWLQVMFNQAPW